METHHLGSTSGTAAPSFGNDHRPSTVVVEGYRRPVGGSRRASRSPATEAYRLGIWTERRGWKLAAIVEEHASPDCGPWGQGLRGAVCRVESRHSDGMVVPSLAHLAALPQEALSVIELIMAAGGVFASVQECLDLSTASGRRRYLRLCRLYWSVRSTPWG